MQRGFVIKAWLGLARGGTYGSCAVSVQIHHVSAVDQYISPPVMLPGAGRTRSGRRYWLASRQHAPVREATRPDGLHVPGSILACIATTNLVSRLMSSVSDGPPPFEARKKGLVRMAESEKIPAMQASQTSQSAAGASRGPGASGQRDGRSTDTEVAKLVNWFGRGHIPCRLRLVDVASDCMHGADVVSGPWRQRQHLRRRGPISDVLSTISPSVYDIPPSSDFPCCIL